MSLCVNCGEPLDYGICRRCDYSESEPEPTYGEYCADQGHPYYGDYEGVGRCYCGYRMNYPLGGKETNDIS